jgi:hypothetical protein
MTRGSTEKNEPQTLPDHPGIFSLLPIVWAAYTPLANQPTKLRE